MRALTIEKALGGSQYLFSLKNSTAADDIDGNIACAITAPTAGATLTQGTPTTITGTITVPGTVIVKLGSTTLGGATMVGLNWSYVYTPQSGDVGAQTINATATATVGGVTANAPGVAVTVASGAGTSYASLLTSPLQVVQTDMGLTYGGTPRASGSGTPPVATLGGTLTKDGAVPLWLKCTSGGAIGSGAVFAAYIDDAGITPIMTGITPTAGTPIAITGSSVLSGMTVAWAAGTAATDQVWKATCAGLADQSGAGKHYTQTTPTLQPVIKLGLNGKVSLGFSGSQCLVSALNVATPWSQFLALRRNTWSGNANYAGANSAGNLGVLYDTASSPIMAMYAGGTPGANSNSNLALGTYGAIEAAWAGSTSDSLRLGSVAAVTGASAGSSFGTGRNIGANGVGASGDFDFLMSAIYPPQSTAALRTALNTSNGYGVGSVLA